MRDMACDICEDLAISYMLAVDAVAGARKELNQAVTQTQIECASTKLFRVEAHRLGMLKALQAHCDAHGGARGEVQALLAAEARQESSAA